MSGEDTTYSPEERAAFGWESGDTATPEKQAVTETPADTGEAEVPADTGDEERAGEPAETEDKGEQKSPKMVRLEALHEERTRRKEAEERAKQYEQRFQQFVDKMSAPQQQSQQAEQQAPPNWDESPIDAGKYTAQRVETVEQRLQRIENEKQQAAAYQQFTTAINERVQEFAKETPDYFDAYAWLKKDRADELVEVYGRTPQEAAQIVAREELSLAADALQRQKNPAELVYAHAKRRGYKAVERAEAEQQEQARDEQGRFRAQAEGQKTAGRSLSNAGGRAAPALTLESIVKMDDKEFAALPAEKVRQMYARTFG